MCFSIPESSPRHYITFNHLIFLSSLGLWQTLGISLPLMTLTVLRNTGYVSCRWFHIWDLPHVFLIIRLKLEIFGRKTSRVKCHYLHITTIMYQWYILNITFTVDVRLAWLQQSLVRFLHINYWLPFLLFPSWIHVRKSLCTSHTRKVGRYGLPSWRRIIYINYFNFTWKICLFCPF